MKLGSLASSRNQYLDRNGLGKHFAVQGAYTGSSILIQTTVYTVPTAKKFLVSGYYLYHRVSSALLTAGDNGYGGFVSITATGTLNLARHDFSSALTLHQGIYTSGPASFLMTTGESLRVDRQAITITTGNLNFIYSIFGVEYDA